MNTDALAILFAGTFISMKGYNGKEGAFFDTLYDMLSRTAQRIRDTHEGVQQQRVYTPWLQDEFDAIVA